MLELKTTVTNQASEVHAAVLAKGPDYSNNIDKNMDTLTKDVGGALISYTFGAPGTAALHVLDNCFDANACSMTSRTAIWSIIQVSPLLS